MNFQLCRFLHLLCRIYLHRGSLSHFFYYSNAEHNGSYYMTNYFKLLFRVRYWEHILMLLEIQKWVLFCSVLLVLIFFILATQWVVLILQKGEVFGKSYADPLKNDGKYQYFLAILFLNTLFIFLNLLFLGKPNELMFLTIFGY